jgi:pimeloyl-ACP methyl ester carboxylesterase
MLRAIVIVPRLRSSGLQRSWPIRRAIGALRSPALRALTALMLIAAAPSVAADSSLSGCRLKGIEREVQCGSVTVPEDPDQPAGRRITIRYAIVPALAKNKSPDPLFVLAGGPGQAAMQVAALMQPVLSRLNARRDIVYVDQRGTGQSNALACTRDRRSLSIAESVDPARAIALLDTCLGQLRERADTRQYATWIAMRDLDAVRAALGAERINLWGGSYGTRAALEYLRQFPQRVRSLVLDGMAPATMALPASFAVDSETALARQLAACAEDAACRALFPELDNDLKRLLFLADRGTRVSLHHPLTGAPEQLVLDRTVLAGLLRTPLYAPQLTSVLPFALAQAGRGRYDALIALNAALSSRMAENFAEVMHFAVVCAEDLPRVDAAARAAAASTRFASGFIELYERACARIAVRPVPAAFYTPASADVPVLLLSGGADPVTPPRHGDLVARTLPRALHLTAPNLGHGVSHHGCAPELIARFVRQADQPGRGPFAGIEDGKDAGCLERLPAPPAFRPPGLAAP